MPGETETAITVAARNNRLANASTRTATIAVAGQGDNISSVTPDNLELSVEPDNEAIITPQPQQPALGEGDTRDVIFTVAPPLAQRATITATPSDEGQISISARQLAVAAEQTTIALSVTAVDDDIKEPLSVYTVNLSVAGHARAVPSQVVVFVFEDGRDTIALVTTAAVTLVDDSLAEGDMTILTARLGDPLTSIATLTLSNDDGLVSLGDEELVFAQGETETTIAVAAEDNGLADANARIAAIDVADRSANISSVTPDSLELDIEPDNVATITPQPTRLTIDEGETRDVVFTVAPPLAQPATVTAVHSNQDQIAISGERLTVAAEQAQVTLNITVTDDDVEETENDYVIDLSVEGHATLAEDQITVTVPANDQRVADPRDIDITTEGADGEDGVVAENSPAGSAVGITVEADHATAYALTDSAEGRFAISSETGIVTVADSAKLNFEDATSHAITARAGNRFAKTASITLTVEVVNVDEIALVDIDSRNNLALASAGAVVSGMTP